MTDYNAMIRQLFTAPARAMTAQPPKANLGGGMIEKLHNAIDPVQAMGGYGNLAAMALPPGAPKVKIPSVTKTGHAKIGGETAESNGFFYKGGQFLPSTDLPPGSFRVGKKLVKARKMEIEPYKWEAQPTADSRALFPLATAYSKRHPETGKLVWGKGANEGGYRDARGQPITPETRSGWGDTTYGDLMEMYNNGMRWLEVPKKP
jgi:hypothetical protein